MQSHSYLDGNGVIHLRKFHGFKISVKECWKSSLEQGKILSVWVLLTDFGTWNFPLSTIRAPPSVTMRAGKKDIKEALELGISKKPSTLLITQS